MFEFLEQIFTPSQYNDKQIDIRYESIKDDPIVARYYIVETANGEFKVNDYQKSSGAPNLPKPSDWSRYNSITAARKAILDIYDVRNFERNDKIETKV